jgi:tRNA U34 5-methylaminomethyl-2-thiouridine-forming methyltransferase MnmC
LNVIQTADGSPTLFSERYNESFHSTFGAATESRYVFLETSGVSERLSTGQATRILEIGFGLGLNALLSCDAAIASNTPLSYHAFEHDYSVCELGQHVVFSQLLEKPELAGVLQTHLGQVKRPSNGQQNPCTVIEFAPDTTLKLHWGDATTDIPPMDTFDAIYLDAFSPDNNPECWTPGFFERLKPLMSADAKLSTYCAKGSVRRALIACGFLVKKLPGPPGKREIMVASLRPDG